MSCPSPLLLSNRHAPSQAFVRAASRTASVVGRRVAAPTPVRTTTRRMMSHDGTPEELARETEPARRLLPMNRSQPFLS